MPSMINSYTVHPKCNVVLTRPRFFDVRYTQVYLNLKDVIANEEVLDIPIGPPLSNMFQIFQIRMTCESPEAEYALHTRPYADSDMNNWIFKCLTDTQDEMLQETWLVKPDSICDIPHLFFSFKELAGIHPGNIRLELRITG